MRVVVTGATGHLGRYVVHHLASVGYEVVAASKSGKTPDAPFQLTPAKDVRAIAIDITEDACIDVLAPELGADVALVHLAAWHPPATATTSVAERHALLETNVHGTMRVFEAGRAKRGGCKAVVYASTFEVYGDSVESPVTEATRVRPVTDYGATKLAGEDHLYAFGYEDGVRGVSLRFPAIYGPGEHTSRALPNFLRSVARGEAPTIYGDGGDLRDQLHARDAALAIEKALSANVSGIYNVADGEAHSIAELADVALAVAQMRARPTVLARAKDRLDFHMSIERARVELGFVPQVSLHDGMLEELAWLRTGG